MADLLLDLARNRTARKVIGSLGLPIPMPQELARADGADGPRPLQGRRVLIGAAPGGGLAEVAMEAARAAGAEAQTAAGQDGESGRVQGLVYDASSIDGPDGLAHVHSFLQPRIGGLDRCGRLVVLGRPPADAASPAAAAAAAALEGFVRSAAKELGRKGATALLLRVAEGAKERLSGPLRFALSRRSAYVSGQVLEIDDPAGVGVDDSVDLANKVALVTGAARGIGAAIARRLGEQGAVVVGLDRPGEEAALADLLGGSEWALAADLGDATAGQQIADHLQQRHGGVDIVVHNAGVTRDRTLKRMKPDRWQLVLDVNLAAVLRVDEALQALLRPGCRVICMSSIAGIAGNPGQTNYACAKAGLIGYVRACREALAARGGTINAVAPGFIETRMTADMPVAVREAARRLNSLNQGGLPRDVADAVAFLASPGASGLNGATMRVCGQHLSGA